MKRIIAILLCISLILSGCDVPELTNNNSNGEAIASSTEGSDDVQNSTSDSNEDSLASYTENSESILSSGNATESINSDSSTEIDTKNEDAQEPEFTGLDDADLLTYIENTVYEELVEGLDSSDYYVEKTSAVYISNEYLEESAYNSQTNIYFGYSLEEIENEFNGTKYVFTLGDDGTTVVQEFEDYDDTYDQIIRNVAVGSGVILVCITVSLVSGGLNAPAISMIFAASAKTGTAFALSLAVFSGVAKGIVTGIETQDFDEALKAAELGASEGFMWGAISGAILGGASEAVALHGATLNGLSMNDAAQIQYESKWKIDSITSMHSVKEYYIYKQNGVVETQLSNGRLIYIPPDLDWTLVDSNGLTNIERVNQGLAPIDSTGISYELHHMGQKADGPLVILTHAQHHSSENYSILHWADVGKNISKSEWEKEKDAVWKEVLELTLAAA